MRLTISLEQLEQDEGGAELGPGLTRYMDMGPCMRQNPRIDRLAQAVTAPKSPVFWIFEIIEYIIARGNYDMYMSNMRIYIHTLRYL